VVKINIKVKFLIGENSSRFGNFPRNQSMMVTGAHGIIASSLTPSSSFIAAV